MQFAIISVGNEILSGDIENTNAAYMARRITLSGHRVERIVTVPDSIPDIAEEVRRLAERYDFVLVTGGLGATHDDVTAEAIAKALGKKLVKNDEAVRVLMKKTNNKDVIDKIAMLPESAEIVENDVGVAPAFVIENIAVMPGVPAEMRDTFEKIFSRFERTDHFVETLRVEGYEEDMLERLNEVVKQFPDVEIGSYPKPGYVIVKFSGNNLERVMQAKRFLEALLK
jgi:molybdenum cofactor synthesis domain-containing protein